MTITMAAPAAAASGSADCPGIDLRDPLGSVKCPVDGITQRILPSRPATTAPATSPIPTRTSASTTKPSGGDQSVQSARPARRSAPATTGKAGRAGHRGGASNDRSVTGFPPTMPASVRLPQVQPGDPYPQVAGDPAYDGSPGHGRAAGRAASAEDARILWAKIATALLALLCALHLRVATRLLRPEADRHAS